MPLRPLTARIAGYGMTKICTRSKKSPDVFIEEALNSALYSTGLQLSDIDGVIAIPSLAAPRFMEAHYQATRLGILPHKYKKVRTIDTGGAGPVSALVMAKNMIKHENCQVVCILAADSVSSLTREEFLERADKGCLDPDDEEAKSPVIPHYYSKITKWHMEKYGVTRDQLAMCASLMTAQACQHPDSLTKSFKSKEFVLESPPVTDIMSSLEVARRADGGVAIIVASSRFLDKVGVPRVAQGPAIIGVGEGSGPLYPPAKITEEVFSCEEACSMAYEESQLTTKDIDFFALYDCFPICLIRAIEAVGLAPKGCGGLYIERAYNKFISTGKLNPYNFPINTHGGLMAFGAPWEVPAMYNIVEAVDQLNSQAKGTTVPNCRRALVYGNGGIFSHSSVAILVSPLLHQRL